MKRLTLTTAVLAILMAPAAFAQSTLNTTAPGASQETKPGQTNNNLQNPGSHMSQPSTTTQTTAPDSTATTTNTDTMGTTTNTDTTGTTTGTMNNTDSNNGAMTNSNTDSTSTGNAGSYNGGTTSSSTTTSSSLPHTASNMPMVALAGLLAMFAALGLRFARS
jgi:cobalamin biosynthesis Mg chelatase CobN